MHDGSVRITTTAGTMAWRTEGVGPAVLLVHGIPGAGAAWDAVADGLTAGGSRVLVPDLLGFGDSDRPTGAGALWVDAQAVAIREGLDQMEVGEVVLVGHDYGVPTAITLAQQLGDRVAGMVLAAGNVFTDTPIPVPLQALTLPLVGQQLARVALSGLALRMMLRAGVGRPRVQLDPAVHVGDRSQQHAIRTIFTTALRELSTRYAAVEDALPTLDVPVRVLWGDRDPFFPVEQGRRVAAAIPGATLEVLAAAGHFLPAERPEQLVAAVDDVLAVS